MHDDATLVERRIRRELGDRLMPAMYRELHPLAVEAWDTPGEPVTYREAMAALAAEARPFAVPQKWGRPWGTTWFRLTGDVPGEWSGSPVEAVLDLGFHPDAAGFQAEGLVWAPGSTGDGLPVQGIHPRRTAVPLAPTPGPVELVVEAASNPAFPMVGARAGHLGSLATAGDTPQYTFRQAALGLRDDDVFHLLLDAEVLLGLLTALPAGSRRREKLLRALERAFDAIDMSDARGVQATAATARHLLAPALASRNAPDTHEVIAVGHAHIDTAWLWPLRETQRKCARTFASATAMIDLYPDFHFVCSQAAQYAWIEQQHPALFERIRGRVAGGQWHPVGGMWVEADMNLPGGESLARQLVHGQRYFESRFGVRCREVWIPDVFGYPASLPQIFRAGGCARFVTQKLSWNKTNVFPHSTFWWKGLDGSRVLAHFPPVDTYNATVIGEELVHSERNFKEHAWSDVSLLPFGFGNGGGGPTREMIERAHRLADLQGAPRVRQGTTDEFFARVEAEAAVAAERVPVWDGELYFETHRGTLTSQARTKVGNRRCERLLYEAELWWSTAEHGAMPTEVADELDALWKVVLLHQFHDIIPGSSITWVHDDTEAAHAQVAARLEELIAVAMQRLAAGTAVANAAGRARREVLVAQAAGPLPAGAQALADGRVAQMVAVPAFGVASLASIDADTDTTQATHAVHVTEHSFANGLIAMSWGLDGTITSIIDVRAGREVLLPGAGVHLDIAPDRPVEYDAWDLEHWTRRSAEPLAAADEVVVVDSGPLLATLRIIHRLPRSTIVQHVTMRAGSARLDIAFDIDWHDDEQLLTLAVPVDVRAREAACDIQFGHVMRPTHASTSWDAAKFEVCAHRFADLSEPSFGVAVLNDGRYGHALLGDGMRVSLLRAARFPSPVQDIGRHTFTVSILPHGPGLHEVLHEAEALNVPLRVVRGGVDNNHPPMVSIDHPGVQVTAVKRADDGSGDLVVRLYEALGDHTHLTVRTPWRIAEADACNLLEEPQHSFEVSDGIVALALRPFEIVTLRVR